MKAAPRIRRQTCSANSSSPDVIRQHWSTTTALVAVLLLAQPAFAQDAQELDELIPRSAEENPEEWAAQGVSPQDEAAAETQPELPVGAPLTEMPLVTVPWPENVELPELAPLESGDEDIEFARFEDEIGRLPEGSEERLSDELVLVFPTERTLFPERDDFLDRFEALSTVEENDADGNLARLAAQARVDEELLLRLLRVYGYFGGQVIRTVGMNGEQPEVRFDVIPGQRFLVGTVDLGNLAATGENFEDLRAAYAIQTGDPVSLDAIANQQMRLDSALGESGYPFAEIDAPSLLVDHDRTEGDITMPVQPGGQYVFGEVRSDHEDFLSSRHLTRIARWDAGEIYQRSDQIDLRRTILATGLVGSTTLTPIVVAEPQGDQPGVVDIAAELEPAPLRTVAGNIGFGTEVGVRVEAMWEHRNLFPPEGLLRVRGILGTEEQLFGVTFQKNNFLGRDRVLTLDAFASTFDTDAFDARTVSLTGNYERTSTLLFQKPLSWGVGFELLATEQAEVKVKGGKSPFESYLIAALPAHIQLDTSDSLLNPTEGFRARASISPEISRSNGSTSTYMNVQFDLSAYQPVGDNVVLAGRARVASIFGAEVFEIAPSRRLYAGGGGSVRGYGYNAIGPRNGVGDPNGGRSLVELSAEARVRTGLMDGMISVIPFVDAGTVSRSSTPDFEDIRVGAGLGVSYDSGFGPLRLDVAFPLNPEPEDSWVAVYLSLGHAF